MGAPMARNLCQAGFSTTVWNRTAAKAMALGAFGALVVGHAAEAVAEADIVISMLSDGPTGALVQADTALRAALRPGTIWVEMGSIKPEEARAAAEDLRRLGVSYVDAPVSGGTKGAEEASLAIMAGGAPEDFDRVAAALSAMGRPVHVGPIGAGQLAKLANQAIVGIAIAAVAEAMLMLQKGGADPRRRACGVERWVCRQHNLAVARCANDTYGFYPLGGCAHCSLKTSTMPWPRRRVSGCVCPLWKIPAIVLIIWFTRWMVQA